MSEPSRAITEDELAEALTELGVRINGNAYFPELARNIFGYIERRREAEAPAACWHHWRMAMTYDTFTRNELMDAFAGLNFGTGNLLEAMESVRRKRREAEAAETFTAAELRAAVAGKRSGPGGGFGEDFADSLIDAIRALRSRL